MTSPIYSSIDWPSGEINRIVGEPLTEVEMDIKFYKNFRSLLSEKS